MQNNRYSCQISLNDFGQKAQNKIKQSKVLIVGMGGLGCPASLYLTSMGIGTLGIIDFDKINRKNLHRQILYGEKDLGHSKVKIAKKKLQEQNPDVQIEDHDKKITTDNAIDIIKNYDIVLDCTDNFDTRYLLNDACVIANKPLIYGAIFQYEGQVAIWNLNENSVNYRDIFSDIGDGDVQNCADGGVIPTIAGITGCVQATEAIKYLANLDGLLENKLFIFDAKCMTSHIINLPSSSSTQINKLPDPKDTNVDEINIDDFKTMDKDDYLLIDVRSSEEHKTYNIGGINIPMDLIDDELVRVATSNKSIVFYCASGIRSLRTVKKVKKLHPSMKVLSLRGGINS